MEKNKDGQGREKRDVGFYVRMTKSEIGALEMASYAIEESKCSIVRKALKMYLSTLNKHY